MPVAADNKFQESFNVASHGFSEWDVLRRTGTGGSHTEAQADTSANVGAGKVVLCVDVPDVNNYSTLDLRGARVELETGNGLGGTFGDPIYLDAATAGAMTLTKPTGNNRVFYLGYWIDANTIFWDPWPFDFHPQEAP